jgi:hypothetical protein
MGLASRHLNRLAAQQASAQGHIACGKFTAEL